MYKEVRQFIFCLGLIGLSACGTSTVIEPAASSDEPIDESFDFDASLNQTSSQFLSISNNNSQPITVSRVIMTNNVCGAFVIEHVVNSQNALIAQSVNNSFQIPANQSVYMKVNFSPVYCPQHNNYYTDVMVVKVVDGIAETQVFKLHVEGVSEPSAVEEQVTCEAIDDNAEYIPLIKSGIPCEGQYYLKVTGMQAMIYVIKAADNSAVISTSATPTYEPTYLPITVGPMREVRIEGEELPRQVADFTIPEVTPCHNFSVPSKKDDAFFGGSDTLIMTKAAASGEIRFISDFNQLVRKTVMSLDELKIKLKATGLETLIADEGGNFQISLDTPLTTELSSPTPYLGVPYEDVVSAQGLGLDFLNVAEHPLGQFALQGFFSDQGMKMVGIGSFNDDDGDFLGDAGTAKNFLIDNPALLAIELDMVWTYKAGDEFPEGCGTL